MEGTTKPQVIPRESFSVSNQEPIGIVTNPHLPARDEKDEAVSREGSVALGGAEEDIYNEDDEEEDGDDEIVTEDEAEEDQSKGRVTVLMLPYKLS